MIFFVIDESKSKLVVTCSDNMDQLDIEAAVASKEEPTVIVKANESLKVCMRSKKAYKLKDVCPKLMFISDLTRKKDENEGKNLLCVFFSRCS